MAVPQGDMMTIAAVAGFSLAMTVLAASPGPGVFGVVGRALASGVRKTLFMIAGIVTGDHSPPPTVYLSGIMVLYAHLASSLGQLVKTPCGRKTMNRSAGGIMMAAGAFLALKR